MNNTKIQEMSVTEKISAMELLWDDLCQNQQLESPQWHEAVLDKRAALRAKGEEPLDWELAKKEILKNTK